MIAHTSSLSHRTFIVAPCRTAVRGTGSDGKARVMMVFGEDEDHIEVLGMTVPDARRLITILKQALDAPVRRPRTV